MTEAQDNEATADSTLGPPEPTCVKCGYNLKGTASPVCPECGTAKAVRVEFLSREQYDRACMALSDAGLILRRREPRADPVGLAIRLGGWSGIVWIDQVRQREAHDAMLEAGVYELGSGRPIVDRAEPECPRCGEALDPDGPSVCGACGCPFDWVSIEEPDIDTTGLLCRECGYDLTAMNSDRCPECGSELPADLLVEAAAGEAESSPTEVEETRRARRRVTVACFAAFVGLVSVVILVAAMLEMDACGGPAIVVALCVLVVSLFILRYASIHENA